MPRCIDARAIALQVQRNLMPNVDDCGMVTVEDAERHFLRLLDKAPTVDAVEVGTVSEQIIRKKGEVSDYWMNDVKQYRATQGYSDIEHDVDNFLRGYNEAVEDMLAILYGERKDGERE